MNSNQVKLMLLASVTQAATRVTSQECADDVSKCTWDSCNDYNSVKWHEANRKFCDDDYCRAHPEAVQCHKPLTPGSDAAKCNADPKDCTFEICDSANYQYLKNCHIETRPQGWTNCPYGEETKCKYDLCHSSADNEKYQFCTADFCEKNPSERQCLKPGSPAFKCHSNSFGYDCSAEVCYDPAYQYMVMCQSWIFSNKNHCRKTHSKDGARCTWAACHSDLASNKKYVHYTHIHDYGEAHQDDYFCSADYCKANPTKPQCNKKTFELEKASWKCRDNEKGCNAEVCYSPLYKDLTNCSQRWIIQQEEHCWSSSLSGGNCTWDTCQSSEKAKEFYYCKASYCEKNPSKNQCINPADAQKCGEDASHCTSDICKSSDYKDIDSCKFLRCKSNAADCTYEICKSDLGKDTEFCKKSYQKAHPNDAQFWNPVAIAKCKADVQDCTVGMCKLFGKDFNTCKALTATMKQAAATKAATLTAAEGKSLKEAEAELTKLQADEKTAASAVVTSEAAIAKAKCFTTGVAAADCITLTKKLKKDKEDAAAYKEAIAAQERHIQMLKKDDTTTTIIVISVVASVLVLGGVGFYCHHKKKSVQQEGAQFTNDVYTAMVDGEY